MIIREMRKQDIDFALYLTSNEGWGSIDLDFRELLEFDPEGSFIAEIDDTPVGMICTVPYRNFGFVCNLIVLERYRQKRLGTIMMDHALAYLTSKGITSHLLDGVEKAVTLYERFDFEKICKSLRLVGHIKPKESKNVRQMTQGDLDEIDQFDAKFFGANRKSFIQSRFKHFPNLCKVLDIDGDLAGYIMGSKRHDFIRIGPWVMKANLDCAENLLRGFASECGDMPLQIGLLENNVKALQILQKYDFTLRSFSWRMIRGVKGDWTLSDHLYAIHSAARG